METVIFWILAAGVGVLAIWSYRQDRRRRRLLRSWARHRGFRMHAERRDGWEHEYAGIKLFDRGTGRHSVLHLEGELDGRRVRFLDYRYTTGGGKNRKVHRHGVVIVDADTPVIPLCIRPEHLFDRVGEFFGHDDIDFESAEFSRRFHVSSSDRRWAYDVIHGATMDYLLAAPPVTVEFGFGEVAVYRPGWLEPRRCQEDLKIARRMLDLVPDDVLAQLRGGT